MITVGASELPVLLGLQRRQQDGEPWVSELELYARLTGQIERYEDDPSNVDAEIGRWSEATVARRFSVENHLVPGVDVWAGPELDQPGLHHPDIPWLHVRPDAMVTRAEQQGTVELKAPRDLEPERWGQSGTDQMPPDHFVQVVAQVAVAHRLFGWELGYLAAMARAPRTSQRVFVQYVWRRDRWLEERTLAAGSAWYERHVVARVPPPADGSRSASWALRRMWRQREDVERYATSDEEELVRKLLSLREVERERDRTRRFAEQALLLGLRDATVLRGRDGSILATWRAGRDGVRRLRFPGRPNNNGEE